MLPRTLALAVNQIELTVAVYIATSMPVGSLAIFYFAQHLNALPVGLFGATIGQAVLPTLSQEEGGRSSKKFRQLLITSLNQVLYLSLPASMILLILRVPAVRLAFGTRNFPWQATIEVSKTVALFAISIFAQSAIQILVRGFYALSNTRIPLLLGGIAVLLNVCLSFSLTYGFGLGILGLALAISISSFIHAGLLLWFLSRFLGGFTKDEFLIPFIKMSLATICTGLSLWIPLRVLDRYILNTAKTLDLIILSLITSAIGFSVYIFISKLFKIRELNSFISLLHRFKNLSKTLSQTQQALSSFSDRSQS